MPPDVKSRLAVALESRPILGWIASGFSLLTTWFAWFVEHADDFAKIFGLVAALFGLVAGYYTMRIQRRAWRRNQRRVKDWID